MEKYEKRNRDFSEVCCLQFQMILEETKREDMYL